MSENYFCVENCPKWRSFWVMIDLSNGHPGGRTYFWAFKTKREALEHKKMQYKSDHHAKLSPPQKVEFNPKTS